jgi:hypothetical protein
MNERKREAWPGRGHPFNDIVLTIRHTPLCSALQKEQLYIIAVIIPLPSPPLVHKMR